MKENTAPIRELSMCEMASSHRSQITYVQNVEEPTHVVKCSGTAEYAYVVSLKTCQAFKKSWIGNDDDDDAAIEAVNDELPDLPEITSCFSAKLDRTLSEFHLCDKIVGFSDKLMFDKPDAIFFQRVSPRLKTFDMVAFYGSKPVVFSIVDKSDLPAIRDWYDKKIYSCGIDPLPLTHVKTRLRELAVSSPDSNPYDTVYGELFELESEESESEYAPSEFCETETESEVELASEEEGCLDSQCFSDEEEDSEHDSEEVSEDENDDDDESEDDEWQQPDDDEGGEDDCDSEAEECVQRSPKRQKTN